MELKQTRNKMRVKKIIPYILYVVVTFASFSLDQKMATNTVRALCPTVNHWNAALVILRDFFSSL